MKKAVMIGVLLGLTGLTCRASANAVDDFGLTGKWAVDCSIPASANSWYVFYTATKFFLDLGEDAKKSDIKLVPLDIENSTIVSATKITVVVSLKNLQINEGFPHPPGFVIPDSQDTSTLEKGKDGKLRVWQQSRITDGSNSENIIKDGLQVYDHQPSPWREKCLNQ